MAFSGGFSCPHECTNLHATWHTSKHAKESGIYFRYLFLPFHHFQYPLFRWLVKIRSGFRGGGSSSQCDLFILDRACYGPWQWQRFILFTLSTVQRERIREKGATPHLLPSDVHLFLGPLAWSLPSSKAVWLSPPSTESVNLSLSFVHVERHTMYVWICILKFS